ncbi:divalent metal cation transporter [Acidisoma cellulosilytica]|uniref:Divalent metal cation transporter n=1 Tax=Acidisoma cellulosilyticum TaxID=2802395 RepID=A0A963YZZ2_9PROT|nr:divalent metal cation transporter [Acidisoma cellulosilyticum]MCB8879999.1 divalent metal cation transporter [Acidisoma cellulosilyticum]
MSCEAPEFETAPAGAGAALAADERQRALDRLNILRTRAAGRSWRLLWLLAGPGVLVMLGENDGPSMVSYATTGATYGVGFFVPFILATFAMSYIVQEMTVRLGIATGRGHAELIFQRFGPFWGYFAMADLVFGNVLTLVTEFIAIQAGGLYFGLPAWLSVVLGIITIIASLGLRRYATWERVLMVLAGFNLLFIPAALFAHPDGHALTHALVHWGPLPGGFSTAFVTLILANIGATVTPWMVFFQQSAVVDKGLTEADLPQGRMDTAMGALIAAIAAIATVVATAPLFHHHVDISNFASGADFATALRPYIGSTGATLFALGIIEAGLVAAMTISTSSSYAFAETLSARHSLNLNFRDGKLFYGAAIVSAVLAGAVVLIPGAPLLAMTLTVNVIATLLMAPALLFLLLLVNDRMIMGKLANGTLANIAGGTIVVAISLVGALYGLITVFPGCLG